MKYFSVEFIRRTEVGQIVLGFIKKIRLVQLIPFGSRVEFKVNRAATYECRPTSTRIVETHLNVNMYLTGITAFL